MFDAKSKCIDLKGKEYLQVAWRLVWLREEHPNWCIETSLLKADENGAVFSAKLMDENGRQISSGHGSETKRDFGDYLEKAETKAVGRCLAMAGYGTQFTGGELDEGERIVDSPVEPAKLNRPTREDFKRAKLVCSRCGKTIEPFGKVSAETIAERSKKVFGVVLCTECGKAAASDADHGSEA